jgi:signal transduction histidine kinase
MAGAPGCSHWIEFGAADGLRSRETATNSHPSAWRSRDGHLWFATPKGLVEVDPAHFPGEHDSAAGGAGALCRGRCGQALRGADSFCVFQAGHVHFQFDYAGLSFTAPQKVRYRYMLEGFDRGWTEAGARRSAYYTNIPPGRTPSACRRPTTTAFGTPRARRSALRTAAALLSDGSGFMRCCWRRLVGLVVLLLRRGCAGRGEFRAVLGERNRIAREIHDTLAQGYVGISVQLEVLASCCATTRWRPRPSIWTLTRGYVREGLADARQSIWALRSQDSGETTLPVRLRRMVEAAGGDGLEIQFSHLWRLPAASAGTEREFLRVAQEAIHNVKKHAGARHLFVSWSTGRRDCAGSAGRRARVCGGEEESAPGHYGLTGMRERAAAIGGTLEVTSEPGGNHGAAAAPAPGFAA